MSAKNLLLLLVAPAIGVATEAAVEGPVVLTVLAKEFTLGPDGPPEDITLAYSVSGGRPWTDLFGGRFAQAAQTPALGRLADFLAMNHVRPALGNQRPVAGTVSRSLDGEGRVRLTDHQLLVLFEVGTTDPIVPAYDFQDLVVLLTFEDLKALAAVPRRTPGTVHD